jgi:glycosyltransferase involved in cell wall biosynthesis
MSAVEQKYDRDTHVNGVDSPSRESRDTPVNSQLLPVVSIVTPAYNEEKHLAECIESVLAQTYSNWDYTIVNNCSTDGTLAIALKYAAENPRIRVISNKTLVPAIANFNIALRQISPASKYTKIVLADDELFPECLERMVAVMEKHPSVGIVGAYGLKDPEVLWAGLPYSGSLFSGREVCRRRLLGGPYVFGSQTSVLYRSDLVRSHDPFYDESSTQPDSDVCFELLKGCDFGFVHQVLTISPERGESLLAAARELNTAAPDTLSQLVAFGPYYLTPREYEDTLRLTLSKYYHFLAGSFLRRRNGKFWDYHRGRLKKEGIPFSRIRLARTVVEYVAGSLFRRMRVWRSERQWGL